MKRSIKSLILLGVLVLLLGSYALVNRMTQSSEVREEEGSFALTQRSADELIALHWTSGSDECNFEKKDEEWRNSDDASFPTDSDAVQDVADRLISMQASRKLSDVEKPEDYGFSDDSYAVTAGWSDGTSTRYILGDATPFGDGYYLRIEGEDGVIYTATSSLSEMFAETLTDLAVLEEIPTVDEPVQLIVGTQLELIYEQTSISIDPDQHWYATDGGEPMDDDAVDELIEDIASLAWEELISTSATEEELADWQLSDETATRVLLLGEDGERLELLVGSVNDDGAYHARLSGSDMVYTLSAESVEAILNNTAEQLWNREIFPLEYADVARFTCALDGRTLEFVPEDAAEDAEAEDAESEDAETETDAEDPTEELWNSIRDLTATGHCADEPAGEALLTITASNTSGMQVQYSFYSYDVDSYQITTDEGRSLLTSADAVDKLIRRLKQ
ncbi:MAG: DUF4340 domain-containing protein [Aristaeellaceae bacterium]